MKKWKETLIESSLELKKLRVLTTLAVMGALSLALKAADVDIGGFASIGFAGIPNQVVDMLFGPVTGTLFGGAMDILKFFIKPSGAFHFGYTFNAMLAAFIYGCFYYKRPVSFWRILAAKALIEVVVNLGFGTLWSAQLYGRAFLAALKLRIGWSLFINWPLNTAVFYLIAKGLEKAGVFRLFRKDQKAASRSPM